MDHDSTSESTDDHTLIGPEGHHDFGDRFKVIRWLGRGGMGDVYLAMDNTLHRKVAIKVIRPDLSEDQEIRQRIERECLLHAKVGPHPNIVTLFDKLERGGELQLIMEFVEGQTLREYLDTHQQNGTEPPRSEAFRITMQMLEALARIHAEGIVHRDIKPANVMLTRDDDGEMRAKLMDFGIARLESGGSQFTNMMRTAAHSSMGSPGTPLYMAPEQFDSDTFGPVSARTDVYAMGIVLYELIATRPPYTGSLTEILRGHLNSPPPSIRPKSGFPVPAPLVSVIQTALAKRPGDRFATAATFRDTLGHLSEIESSSLSEMAALPELGTDHRQKAKDDDDDALIAPARPPASVAPLHSPSQPAAVEVTPPRPPILARVAVIAASIMVLLGIFGVVQVFSGSEETAQAGEPQHEHPTKIVASPDGASGAESVDETSAASADEAAGAVNVAHASREANDVGASIDGLAAAEGIYAVESSDDPAGTDGASTSPNSVDTAVPPTPLAPRNSNVSTVSVLGMLEEGFSMSSEAVDLSGHEPQGTLESGSATATVEMVDPGIGANNEGRIYLVKPGDSLSKIAKEVDVDMFDLAIWNELERPNDLRVGQTLYLYARPGIRKVNPQWVQPKTRTKPELVPVEATPVPAPAPAPTAPAPVVEEEKKGFIGRIVDRINQKQREKKDEMQDRRP